MSKTIEYTIIDYGIVVNQPASNFIKNWRGAAVAIESRSDNPVSLLLFRDKRKWNYSRRIENWARKGDFYIKGKSICTDCAEKLNCLNSGCQLEFSDILYPRALLLNKWESFKKKSGLNYKFVERVELTWDWEYRDKNHDWDNAESKSISVSFDRNWIAKEKANIDNNPNCKKCLLKTNCHKKYECYTTKKPKIIDDTYINSQTKEFSDRYIQEFLSANYYKQKYFLEPLFETDIKIGYFIDTNLVLHEHMWQANYLYEDYTKLFPDQKVNRVTFFVVNALADIYNSVYRILDPETILESKRDTYDLTLEGFCRDQHSYLGKSIRPFSLESFKQLKSFALEKDYCAKVMNEDGYSEKRIFMREVMHRLKNG